ncbi:hypothetical protein MHL32_07560, partial [Roseomonas mucosa]
MRRITKITLAATAALSLGAVVAAPAEAQPYWGPGGGYHRHHGPGPGGALALGLGAGVLGGLALGLATQAAPPPPPAPPPRGPPPLQLGAVVALAHQDAGGPV